MFGKTALVYQSKKKDDWDKAQKLLTDAGIVTPIHQTCRSGFYQYHAFRFQNLWDIDDITATIN